MYGKSSSITFLNFAALFKHVISYVMLLMNLKIGVHIDADVSMHSDKFVAQHVNSCYAHKIFERFHTYLLFATIKKLYIHLLFAKCFVSMAYRSKESYLRAEGVSSLLCQMLVLMV